MSVRYQSKKKGRGQKKTWKCKQRPHEQDTGKNHFKNALRSVRAMLMLDVPKAREIAATVSGCNCLLRSYRCSGTSASAGVAVERRVLMIEVASGVTRCLRLLP